MGFLKKIFISLMALFLIGFAIYYSFSSLDSKDSFTYNNFNIYKTETNLYNIEFYYNNDPGPHYISSRYNPVDLEYIDIQSDFKQKLLKDEIYITLSKNLSVSGVIALAELSKITGNQYLYNIPTHGALTYDDKKNPIKTCEDVSSSTAIVLLRLSDLANIHLSSDDCIIVEATNDDELIKATTRLALTTLGVMK